MKVFPIALLCVLMTGCATRTDLYQWGGYDAMLYQSYKTPEKAVEFRQGLELHITKMEASNQKVAPGLYAELGTLYLQSGDNTKAVSMYKKERDAWPESSGLMDSLITNVAKRSNDKSGEKS
ncbi:MAG: DUF4810 domain-containing protein [Rhodoferax sp.]|nr:DUF4810 domain-containing protein [Rhodoferax sp.]